MRGVALEASGAGFAVGFASSQPNKFERIDVEPIDHVVQTLRPVHDVAEEGPLHGMLQSKCDSIAPCTLAVMSAGALIVVNEVSSTYELGARCVQQALKLIKHRQPLAVACAL